MRRIVPAVLGVSVLVSGCSVSFKFGKPPAAPDTPFRLDDCVFRHSLHLRPAWSSAQRERNPDARLNRARQGRGWTFYRGGKRIDADAALELLRDEKLRGEYRSIWTPVARRGRSRVLGSSVGLAAAALLGITGGVLLHDWPGPGGEPLSGPARARAAAGFALLGVAAAAAVVLPFVMRVGYRDVRAGESFRTLFLAAHLEPSLRRALARYKRRVTEACRARINAAP